MNKKKSLGKRIWEAKYLYLMILPAIGFLCVFSYAPMYGIQLAFKNFKANLGIWGSPWVGLENFKRIFILEEAYTSIFRTLQMSLTKMVVVFPVPILIALMFTELRGKWTKKIYQTIMTFPNFLSWVVTATIIENFLSLRGAVNELLVLLGYEQIKFLSTPELFRPLLYIFDNWKGMGWGSIIYMAAIAGIAPSLYEAAKIDGASRIQQIWHITLPGLKDIISIQLILCIGGLFGSSFDQIFNMRNATVKMAAQTLDTYIYDISFGSVPNYGFSTATGLFCSVVSFILLTIGNKLVYKLTGTKLIGKA